MTTICNPTSMSQQIPTQLIAKPALLLNADEVAELLGAGVSTRSIWRWTHQQLFPQPIRISGRTLWRRRDIERFVLEADGCVKKFNRIRREGSV